MDSYKESELVLNVSKSVDPAIWDEGKYLDFFKLIFRDRPYQQEATETILRYFFSGKYSCLEDLARENFHANSVIQERFNGNVDSFIADLELSQKMSATIDLATGTGKTYVMFAIAAIMLAEKKVDRVLVLAPSVTIEDGLTRKFTELASKQSLIRALGKDFVPPKIINGDQTITPNSIVVENRDAIYEAQAGRNSIIDSLTDNGEHTLVLNDEVHHVYYSEENQWKKFITDSANHKINFTYVVGLTGTAYKRRRKNSDPNEYLSNVIYRYSLKQAIEDGYVKDVQYIEKADMPTDPNERWQVILKSHDSIKNDLNNNTGFKPITIIVTAKKKRADDQAKKFKAFLKKERNISDDEVSEMVLCVHSGASASADCLKLKSVDHLQSKVEFIFSVSMLTEGWDVKRVFQIVPDEERAFNSKLLIAQVLGRGLRKPDNWMSNWGVPKVIVFNHERWAANVRSLVNELLDFKKTITITTDKKSAYNFDLLNVTYSTKEKSKKITDTDDTLSFLSEGFVKLPTDTSKKNVEINLVDISTQRRVHNSIGYNTETCSIDQMAQMMFDRFDDIPSDKKRDQYKEQWTLDELKKMIKKSLENSSNTEITNKIKNRFLSSMNVLFRGATKTITYDLVPEEYIQVKTANLPQVTIELSSLKSNKILYYTEKLEESPLDDASIVSLAEIADTTNSYRHKKIDNIYLFKTPQYGIITTGDPESSFVKRLTATDTAKSIDAFIKSTDTGFYKIEYSWRKGSHQITGEFNPDFFIKKGDNIIIVEIKDDSQIANPDAENIGKYKALKNHVNRINTHFSTMKIKGRYKFTFLTPRNYDVFFNMLIQKDFKGIENFNSELDIKLDEAM